VQNRSDANDKADVRPTVLGLDFINSLRPVDFKNGICVKITIGAKKMVAKSATVITTD